MTLGYATDASGREAPLIDSVGKKHEPRDTGIDDVRAAAAEVGERKNREHIAFEVGDRISAMEDWDRRIEEIGPNAAREAAALYATLPRLAASEVPELDENDPLYETRLAVRQAREREHRQANMPAALSGLDRLEQRHGSLDVVERLRRWDQQFRDNPSDAAPRVGQEIANHINDRIGMQGAYRTLNEYQAKHQVTDAERGVMSRVLSNGVATNLPDAHAIARFETAADIEDPFTRDVVAAQRAAESMQMDRARLTVTDWDRRHPNVSKEIRGRMKRLLHAEKARDLDEAYEMARR